MSVLVDSSVWIAYFRDAGSGCDLDLLIDENLVLVNDLILAELLPPLHVRHQRKLIGLLKKIAQSPITIDWDDIVRLQIICLRNDINRVGIPDLIIAQHAMQNGFELFSYDKHFMQLAGQVPLSLH